MGLNKIILMGRLTADPELKRTANDYSVTSFTLAVDVGYGENKKTDFIDCVAWRQTAEFVTRYFSKGKMIAVEGKIQTRTYEDKNGNKRKAVEVLVEQCFFTGEKASSDTGHSAPPPAASFAPPPPQGSLNDFTDVQEDGDDLPF